MAMQWYVLQAFSNYEKRVVESLKEYIAREGMEEHFGEILVPTEAVSYTHLTLPTIYSV